MSDQEQQSPPLSPTTFPPLSPTIGIPESPHSSGTHSIVLPPRLPTYKEFLQNLVEVPREAIPPDERCPICRVPFGELPEPDPVPENENLTLLSALPLAIELPVDRAVRLPCNFGHLMGDLCLKWHYKCSDSNSCPLDCEELFELGTNDKIVESKDEMLRQTMNGPFRAFLTDWENWNDDDLIIVNLRWKNKIWITSLAGIMCRVACRLTNTPEIILLKLWQKIKYSIEGGLSEELEQHDFPTCLGIGNNGNVERFKQLLRHFSQNVELNGKGRFPPWLEMMMDKMVEVMYLAVQDGLSALNEPEKYNKLLIAGTPTFIGNRLFAYTHYRWYKAGLVGKECGPEKWRRFASLVIVAWISMQRLLSKLRDELWSTDEYHYFVPGNYGYPIELTNEHVAVLEASLPDDANTMKEG